jgi:hypothetical protein
MKIFKSKRPLSVRGALLRSHFIASTEKLHRTFPFKMPGDAAQIQMQGQGTGRYH